MKFKLAMGAAVLLAIAFIVNTAFLRSALTDGYQVFEIKRFLIQIESASDEIEKVLANNKRLSVAKMRGILDRQRQAINLRWDKLKASDLDERNLRDNELVDLSIVLRSGSKLVTTASEGTEIETPAKLVEQILEITNGESSAGLEFVEDNDSYYVPRPLFDNQGRWIVSLVFQFQKEALRNSIAPRLDNHIIPSLLVGLFSVFGIWFLYFQLAFKNHVNNKKDFVFDFVVVMLATLSFSLIVNAIIFERQIIQVSKDNARDTSTEISTRLDHRLSLRNSGLDFREQRLDFSDTFSLFDNFEAIILTNSRGTAVYQHHDDRDQSEGIESAFQSAFTDRLSKQQLLVSEKLTAISPGNRLNGNISIYISKVDIFKAWFSMFTNGITILFITILVMVECLLLYLHLLVKEKRTDHRKLRYELGFIRPAMFLFLFAIDLSMSFVPLHMQSFEGELFGLSRNIVIGLPISAEFLCVGIFLLIAGVWMDRRGWHEPFFVGLFIVGTGSLCSWLASDALMFILSRALVGVGYGLSLMSAQGLIVNFGGKRSRARGFASLFAGLYSGSICGAATGAFLAERFGYDKVFFMGAVIVLALIIFSLVFMRSLIKQTNRGSESGEKPKPKHKIKLTPLLKFIGNPVFIALSLLSSVPASIAVAGFLHFFTPVYLDQIGARESTIGQALILYGICLIYFGPLIGRFIDRSQNKKYYMLTGGLLGGLAFAIFNTDYGLASMIVSIFLLGLSSSFILSSQSTIVLELKESQQLGEGTALGIFRSISRIGQVIGPVIFGWVLLSGDLNNTINYLGFSYIGLMLILAVFVVNHSTNLKDQRATHA
jgi:predicted MFS family arabinose efflux permease